MCMQFEKITMKEYTYDQSITLCMNFMFLLNLGVLLNNVLYVILYIAY